jgi:hypothetical protein
VPAPKAADLEVDEPTVDKALDDTEAPKVATPEPVEPSEQEVEREVNSAGEDFE